MVYLWERGPKSERDEELSRETATIVEGRGGGGGGDFFT